MKSSTLEQILCEELHATKQENRLSLPEGTLVTFFMTSPQNVFAVRKISAIVKQSEYIILETEEGRVFTDVGEVSAIRADKEAGGSGGKLGFSA